MKPSPLAFSPVPRTPRPSRLLSLDSAPSRDLIGPPCRLSNLRPVYYAPLFPELHQSQQPGTSSTKSVHPYSLAEFPVLSSDSSSSSRINPRQVRLQALKRQLAAADLEWRLTRYRVDQFNQDFWSRTNTDFLRARDAWIASHPASSSAPSSSSSGSPTTTPADLDLSPFYAQHLDNTKKLYADYNAQLWRLQANLFWPAIKATQRRWKWRWELWKAGGEQQQQKQVTV